MPDDYSKVLLVFSALMVAALFRIGAVLNGWPVIQHPPTPLWRKNRPRETSSKNTRGADMRVIRILLLGLICGCMPAASGWAATLRAMKLADLTRGADVIFVGTVVSSVSDWNSDRTRIYTRTTFQVEESLKGRAGETIVVETLGGIVKGVGMRAPGTPVFRVKGRHVLFVTNGHLTGTHRVLGWAQGNFLVYRDPHTGRDVVARDLSGLSLLGGNVPTRTHDLDELRNAIHRLDGR